MMGFHTRCWLLIYFLNSINNADDVNFPTPNTDPQKLQKGLWNMITIRGANAGDWIEYFINGEWAGVQHDASGRMKGIGSYLQIGGRDLFSLPEGFNGTIDDVRIYNGFIDNDEVKALYSENGWKVMIN